MAGVFSYPEPKIHKVVLEYQRSEGIPITFCSNCTKNILITNEKNCPMDVKQSFFNVH